MADTLESCMLKTMRFHHFIWAAACCFAFVGNVTADTPRNVNVQAGDLAAALDTLAKQCGVDVVYPSRQLKGMTTKGESPEGGHGSGVTPQQIARHDGLMYTYLAERLMAQQ